MWPIVSNARNIGAHEISKKTATAISMSRSAARLERESHRLRGPESSATVERIIESARLVLLKDGHAAFTTRRVAEAAGMTHGNLNYHFPSKRELLRALIARLLKSYSQRFEAFLSDPELPLGQELERMVRWLWTDAITPETVRVFRELWALALHDAVICRAVDDFYDEALAGVSQLLRKVRPKADTGAIDLLLQLFAMVSEGGTVLYGTRRERTIPPERIFELVPRLIELIAPDLLNPTDKDGDHSQRTRGRGRAR